VTLTESGVAAVGVVVTVSIDDSPARSGQQIAPVLDGTLTATTNASGIATFSGLSIRGPTGNYKLRFTASGYPNAVSNTIALSVGAPGALSLIDDSLGSIPVASPGTDDTVTVTAYDAGGNRVTSGGATVVLNATAGSLGVVSDLGNGTYRAIYTGTSSIADSPVTISGTINGTAITDTAVVTLTAGAASQLVITMQPAGAVRYSGQTLGTQPVVAIRDAFGNATSSTAPVTAALTSGTGTLSGTTTVNAVGGTATFTNLVVTGAASQSYVLTFTSGSLTSAVSGSFSLARAPQTISFSYTGGAKTYGDDSFSVSGMASASPSGLPVSFSSDSAGVCTTTTGGTVTIVTGGTCILRASQAGNADYLAAADDTESFTVNRAAQTITFSYTGGTKTFGDDSFSVASMASATSGLPVSFTSDSSGVCTTTSGGTVTLVAQGTCTLRAAQGGNSSYLAAADDTESFTVNRGATSVSWSPVTAVTMPQSPLTPSALATTAGNGSISYSVDDSTTSGCSVNSSSGVLTYTAPGNCVVRATSAQTSQWLSAFTTVTFVIDRATQVITFPVISGKVYGGAPFATGASVPSNNLVMTSTTPLVCSVAGTTVTMLKAGSCSITASAAQTTSYHAAADVTREFTVAKAAATVTWSPTLAITADDTLSFTPSALATSNGGAIGYSVDSAGTTGCTVNSLTAQVTFVTAGTCAIKATSAERDDTSSGFTVATFTISKATQTITFGAQSGRNYGDAPYAISATTTAPGRLVTFTSLTPTVCGVTGASAVITGATGGTVALLGAGMCTIRASQPGDAVYAAASVVDRSFVVAQGTQAALRFTNSTQGVFDDTLTLATAGGSGTGTVTYALVGGPGTALCSVNTATGDLTFGTAAGGTGSCVVRATKASDGNYSSQVTADTTITVARAVQTVTFTSTVPANPLPGETYLVVATTNSGNTVNLSVMGGSCTISGPTAPATVTFTSTGPCLIFADAAATTNYALAMEQSQSMTVGALSQTITAPTIADRAYGSASFSIAGSTSATSGLAVAYSSDDTSVCTISGSGVVTSLAVGSCVLRITQAGNAQYAPASPVLRTFSVYAVTASRPFIFSASPGDGEIAIAFSSPGFTGGAAVTAYRLIATPTGAGVAVQDDSCTASPCTISGLVNGTEYTVTIAGINTAGVGAASIPSQGLTPVTQAAAVGNLTAVPDATQISLAWTPLINDQLGGGAFVRYDIYLRPTGGSWPLAADDSLAAQSDDSIVLTGLTNGMSYAIKVVAITTANSAEIQGNTAVVYQYAATVPDAPQALIALTWTTDTAALVSWSAPLSDGGRPITGYAITTSAGIGCTPSPSTDDTCLLTGLPLGQTITVSATATNAIGTSIAATTTYTTPSAPVPPGPGPGPNPLPPAPPIPPGPQPLPLTPLPPGGTEGVEDGRPIALTPGANSGGDQLIVTGPGVTLTVTAYDTQGRRIPLADGPTLRTTPGGRISVEGRTFSLSGHGSGFLYDASNSEVSAASGRTSAAGVLSLTLRVPEDATPGEYTLQVNGYSLMAATRSVHIGVIVEAMPWIKAKMKKARGGIMKLTAEALTGEIPSGAVVVPMVKYKGKNVWVKGTSRPKIGEDGTFTWQRKIRRTAWIYFLWIDNATMKPTEVRSNTLTHQHELRT
jgi:hypothetical protein